MTMSERHILRVPFDEAGSLDTSDSNPNLAASPNHGIPVVALEVWRSTEAQRLYGQFCALGDPDDLVTEVAAWVPLTGDETPDGHTGHPLLEFTLTSVTNPSSNPEITHSLGFIACVQCHSQFVQHAAESEWLAVGPSLSLPASEESADGVVVDLIVAKCDPDQVAWQELRAWRCAYTVARATPRP